MIAFNAGPLYHGAPIGGMIATHRLGGTAVTLRKFDALQTLKAIRDFKVVHGQFVPTMFVRLLALPEEVRRSFDLSSLKFVVHAAAPCPVEIKRRMIEWLGPIVYEYYGASEHVGATFITLFPYAIESALLALPGAQRYAGVLFAINYASFGLVMILFLVFEPMGLVSIWHRIQSYFLLWPFRQRQASGSGG